MRTHHLTLLLTAAEKERIAQQARALGISEADYTREAATMLDAEDLIALREAPSLLPEFNAALERIHTNLVAAAERSERTHREIERMRTPEYREEMRRSIAEEGIDLEAVAALFGIPPPAPAAAEAAQPKSATLFKRISNFAKARSHVSESRQPWRQGEPRGKGKPSE